MDKKQTAMTPKEKAEKLVVKYQLMAEIKHIEEPYETTTSLKVKNATIELASKKCALIAVDEIIKTLPQSEYLEDRLEMVENRELIYWKQVKQEIEKL